MGALKYDIALDAAQEGTSHAFMLELVGANKDVLDIGCATGYLAEALGHQDCRVSGVEIDPEAAEQARPHLERLVVGSLDDVDLVAELGEASFDVVVFGDVLEHLLDPLPPLLVARRLLRPGGYVVISVPNVAHGAVRLSLLLGRWDYRSLGLLDDTHVRFFTRENLARLLRAAGLAPADLRRTKAGLFETELGLREDEVEPELVARVLGDPEATTYQFVVRAVLDDADWSVTELHDRLETTQRALAGEQVARAADREQWLEREFAHAAALEELRVEKDAHLTAMHEQVLSRDAELDRLRGVIDELHATRAVRATQTARSIAARLRS